MTEKLIPVEEVAAGASGIQSYKKIKALLLEAGLLQAKVSYTTPVTNAIYCPQTNSINKISAIKASENKIIPDKIISYTVKLDEGNPASLTKDLGLVRFAFWLQKKGKTVSLEKGVKKAIKTEKSKINAIQILSRGNLASEGMKTDFLEIKNTAIFTTQIYKNSYYYAKITVDSEKKEATLQVKYSKWMDGYRIIVEAYLIGDTLKSNGVATTASRYVIAKPEIVEAYWLNATGKKLTTAGYNQDVYLYLNTLGLKGQTLNVGVYDKDYYPNPTVELNSVVEFYARKETDDLITWKNNKIDIKDRETIKQFKVGDKERYKDAQQGEDKEYAKKNEDENKKEWYTMVFDYTEKANFDLDLYVYIENSIKLGFVNPKVEYGKLILTHNEKISDAFFAEIEKSTVQADAPEEDIKNKKKKVIGKKRPTTKVPHYNKLNKGVLGQKIQLVAECANLEGKFVTFEVFDTTTLLGALDTKLSFVFEGKENQDIKVKVKDGYAVAEVVLLKDNIEEGLKEWKNILRKNSKTYKTAELYLKVEITKTVFTVVDSVKEFLVDNPFKLEACKWHDPLDTMAYRGWYGPKADKWAPERSEYLTYTAYRNSKKHEGLDLYASVGTPVYACVDGEVYMKYRSGTYGNVFGIKTNYYGEIYYFFYAHLNAPALFKKGDKVKAGDLIGASGITGNASTQARKNHLHFEVRNTNARSGGRLDVLETIPEIDENLEKNPLESTQS